MGSAIHVRFARCASLVVLCLLQPGAAYAWGNFGHRVTGYIAAALLTDNARKQVEQLLGEESLADAATFMDTHRDELTQRWPAATRWHYDNQRICGSDASYCADGQCATRQIERFRQVLVDQHAIRAERALALRVVVHLLGDIHQPLHMSDNADRGGNDVYVRLYPGAERHRLHEVFDTELVSNLADRHSAQAYARILLSRYRAQLNNWQQGSVMDWAQQSHRLGVSEIYGGLPYFACNQAPSRTITLPSIYVQRANNYVPEQLFKAGIRIASVLNTSLH